MTIVAPIQEASAIGHALTLRRPLRIETIGPNVFAVDGTPTDCVNMAITHVLKGKPDLIVSGINKGWNLGDDVTYSGTVSGALEGALLGDSEHRRLDAAGEGRVRVRAVGAGGRHRRGGGARARHAEVHAAQHQHAEGPNKGFRVTVQAKRNHVTVGERAHGPAAQAVLLD